MDSANTNAAAASMNAYYTDAKLAELQRAFNRVVNAENWKRPIDATIRIETIAEQALIREAVIFYTGSVPEFTTATARATRVCAVGYYIAIGA
jgi:hypothetical protein